MADPEATRQYAIRQGATNYIYFTGGFTWATRIRILREASLWFWNYLSSYTPTTDDLAEITSIYRAWLFLADVRTEQNRLISNTSLTIADANWPVLSDYASRELPSVWTQGIANNKINGLQNLIDARVNTLFSSLSTETLQTLQDIQAALDNNEAMDVAIANASIQSAAVNGSGHLILTKVSGTTLDAGHVVGPMGPNGVGVATATINESGDLMITYTDSTIVNAGHVVGGQGPVGPEGPQGVAGAIGGVGPQGPTGAKGDTGNTGPAGATGAVGATGPSGVVAATLPLTYNSGTQTVAINAATTSTAGSLSAADKTKLDGIATGATALSLASSNPVALGVAAPGVGTTAARADHVHPAVPNATTSVAGLLSATDKAKLDGYTAGAKGLVLLADVTVSENAVIALTAGFRRVAVTVTGATTSDRLVIVLRGAPTISGVVVGTVASHDAYASATNTVQIGVTIPAILIGGNYSIPVAVYKIV